MLLRCNIIFFEPYHLICPLTKTKTMTIIMTKQCFVDILLLQDAKLVGAMTNLKSCKGKNESKLAAAARTKCLTQMRACNGYVEQVSFYLTAMCPNQSSSSI